MCDFCEFYNVISIVMLAIGLMAVFICATKDEED